MQPVGALASRTPLLYWSRLNVPDYCVGGMPNEVPAKNSLIVNDWGLNNYDKVMQDVANYFTVEFWVRPANYRQESYEGWVGGTDIFYQQSFVTFPSPVGFNHAGMGVSVGYNGVVVYEFDGSTVHVPLVWDSWIFDWTHVAVVYIANVPHLYINGSEVWVGQPTIFSAVSPSYSIGVQYNAPAYYYLDEFRIWEYPRDEYYINAFMNRAISGDDGGGLAGYWPMNMEDGEAIKDITCSKRHLTKDGSGSYDYYVPPITEYEYTSWEDESFSPFYIPAHTLPVQYAYNSMDQLVKQTDADAGVSEFWYDRLNRPVFSQDAAQASAAYPDKKLSYTKYDAQGRIIESGEKTLPSTYAGYISEYYLRDTNIVKLIHTQGTNRETKVTAYDQQPAWVPASLSGLQYNLRKRAVATALLSAGSDPSVNRLSANYYSYDILGNVSDLVMENTAYKTAEGTSIVGSDGLKRVRYEYDLISGKVNKTLYQDGKWDQFYQRYIYDADNRVITALSSRSNFNDPTQWVQEVFYRYYPHGPLARTQLGKNKVQGTDYAYTLQGLLKGANANFLDLEKDMSQDSKPGTVFADYARDIFGYSLGYYAGDYTPIGGTSATAFALQYQAPTPDLTGQVRNYESGRSLYNGNISHSTYAISTLDAGRTTPYSYRYDQLSRLVGANKHAAFTTGVASWGNNSIADEYKERITYDGNGNIRDYIRNGAAAQLQMDRLHYGYSTDVSGYLTSNRLRHVKDTVPAGNYNMDIDNQADNNYVYDNAGNLKSDLAAGISNITWNSYGKISGMVKTDGTTISYAYDVLGNRITKTVVPQGVAANTVTTFYVRDMHGSVLSVYEKTNSRLEWQEQHLYGGARLGILNPELGVNTGATINSAYTNAGDPILNGVEGRRRFELINHLGNVMATVSDRKIPHSSNGTTIDYYDAEIMSAQDYYPFGMLQPGRNYNVGTYRYGFNGKENDNDEKGEGNQQDYGMRIYDPRLGRFLSVDPLTKEYPELTPYQFASNRPIDGVDLDGEEWKSEHKWSDKVTDPAHIKALGDKYVKDMTYIDAWRKCAPARLEKKIGTAIDCADLAIETLVHFAYDYKLTVHFEDYKDEDKDPTFDNNNYGFTQPDGTKVKFGEGEWQRLADNIKAKYGAPDVFNNEKIATDKKQDDLQAGDLMSWKHPNGGGFHTQTISEIIKKEEHWYGDTEAGYTAVQGNLDDNKKASTAFKKTYSFAEVFSRKGETIQGKQWNFRKFDRAMPKAVVKPKAAPKAVPKSTPKAATKPVPKKHEAAPKAKPKAPAHSNANKKRTNGH